MSKAIIKDAAFSIFHSTILRILAFFLTIAIPWSPDGYQRTRRSIRTPQNSEQQEGMTRASLLSYVFFSGDIAPRNLPGVFSFRSGFQNCVSWSHLSYSEVTLSQSSLTSLVIFLSLKFIPTLLTFRWEDDRWRKSHSSFLNSFASLCRGQFLQDDRICNSMSIHRISWKMPGYDG